MSANIPPAPETQKMIALQRNVNRLLKFSNWLQEEAKRQECTVDELFKNSPRDSIYLYLGLDLEKLKQENNSLIEHLQS